MSAARTRDSLSEAIRAGAARDYGKAVRLLTDILSRGDDAPEALLYLGRARHAQGRYGRAVACFVDYLKIKPDSAAARLFLGRSYAAAGLPRRAIPYLRQAARMRPRDADAAALLALAYLKARRSAQAVAEFERAVNLAPEDRRIYRGYLNALLVRGIRLARQGDAGLGEQMLRFAVENGAEAVLPRLELARIYREAGAMEAALLQYDRAIELSPDDPQLRWYRASALMSLNDSQRATAELEALRALGADIPELSWNAELVDRFMIRSLLGVGEWKRVAAACSAYLKQRGDDPSIRLMYAEALRELGEYDFAENHARKAVSLAPKEAGLRYELLMVLWAKEDWKGLKTELIAARRLGCDADVLLRFTALLASKLDHDDKTVIALVQDAIRKTGPAPELMLALAARYLTVGLSDLAVPWYRKALAMRPDDEEAALGLIAGLEAEEENGGVTGFESLMEAYDGYLSRYPTNRSIAREYASRLMKRERFEKAIPLYEELLASESGNRTLRRTLAYAYRKTERYKEAVVLTKALLRERPKDTELLLELAHCLDKAGASVYAVGLLEKAVSYLPKDAAPALALGILLERSGKKERALEYYREASARAPKDPRPLRRMEAIYRRSGVAEFADRYAAAARAAETKHETRAAPLRAKQKKL